MCVFYLLLNIFYKYIYLVIVKLFWIQFGRDNYILIISISIY